MSAVLAPKKMSAQAYLEWEDAQDERHEFVDGEVVAMVGGRINHNRITGNAYAVIRQQLKGGPCAVFMTDLRLRVEAVNAYFYPDLAVTCTPADLADGRALEIKAPWLVLEVLSDSTSARDRGVKLEAYRQIASLTHYLLVDATRVHIDLYLKNARGVWELHTLTGQDALQFEQPNAFELPVAAFYEDVVFAPPANSAQGH